MISRPSILMFLHSFEPGGVERVALRLAAAWKKSGADVRTIMGRDEGVGRGDAQGLDYETLQRGSFSTRWFETLWMIWRLPAAVRRHRPDLVFIAGNTYSIVGVTLKWRLGRRCPPLVMKVSNDLIRSDLIAPARIVYRWWLVIQGRHIDHFIGMAEPTLREISVAMRVSADRVSIIEDPSISDADIAMLAAQRRARPRQAPGRRYVAVGRLVPQKNFKLLVRAFADIAGPADSLVILGEGPERRRLERLIDRLGLGGRVQLPGHLDPRAGWLAEADVYVLSSLYEGVPAVIVEALATGLPIVATNCSVSMPDLLDHGKLGRLVPVADRRQLGRAMRLAGTADFSPAAGRARASRFTIEAAAERYLALFALAASHDARAIPAPLPIAVALIDEPVT